MLYGRPGKFQFLIVQLKGTWELRELCPVAVSIPYSTIKSGTFVKVGNLVVVSIPYSTIKSLIRSYRIFYLFRFNSL